MLAVFEKRGPEGNNEMKKEEGVGETACTTAVRNSYKQESTRETQK